MKHSSLACFGAIRALLVYGLKSVQVMELKGALVFRGCSLLKRQTKAIVACQEVTSWMFGETAFPTSLQTPFSFLFIKFWGSPPVFAGCISPLGEFSLDSKRLLQLEERSL